MEDIDTRVTRLEDRVEHVEKEQSDLKEVVNETRNIAESVKIMAVEMTHVKDDVKDIKKTVALHHTEGPNKLITSIKTTAITAIVSAIVGAVLMLILK